MTYDVVNIETKKQVGRVLSENGALTLTNTTPEFQAVWSDAVRNGFDARTGGSTADECWDEATHVDLTPETLWDFERILIEHGWILTVHAGPD